MMKGKKLSYLCTIFFSLTGIIIIKWHQSFPSIDQLALFSKTFSHSTYTVLIPRFSSILPHFSNMLTAPVVTPTSGPDTPTINFSGLINSDGLTFLQLSYDFTQVFSFNITLNRIESIYFLNLLFPSIFTSKTTALLAWILKTSIELPLADYRYYLFPLHTNFLHPVSLV